MGRGYLYLRRFLGKEDSGGQTRTGWLCNGKSVLAQSERAC